AVVAYQDYLLAEDYQEGIDQDARILGWSMTKSVGNALFGIMDKNGAIDIEATPDIPQWQEDDRKDITVSHLLQMSAGLDWTESYSSLTNATRMIFMEKDHVKYSCLAEAEHPPGEHWYYSSGTSNILSGILRNKFDSFDDYLAFPYDSLFAPLGMHSAVIEMDNVGNHVLSSYCWATARDWTRFGLLYLYRGNWLGKQIFTEDWTDYSTSAAPASDGKYGAQIWINENPWRMPSVPTDAFYEQGFGGQRILIVPSMDLVVTVMSGNQPDFDFNSFYEQVFECLGEE
ncbi:MAG TPA: serine hydrolase, partial [Cytophagales bacterium]|nr:serine hydrolase [Cytophagales bacterium]